MSLFNNYEYDYTDKENCWYKEHCEANLCAPTEDSFCQRHYKMHYLVAKALLEGKERFTKPLTPDMRDMESFKRLAEIRSNIFDFVTSGKNVLIYSENCGNGKTEWSKKLLLSWFNSIWHTTPFRCRGLFVYLPKFIVSAKQNLSQENEYYQYVYDNIFDADLVVWDEINYKIWTDFELETLLNIINQRISAGKANIFTTNYDLQTISERLGPRLASRIIGVSECIEFVGADRRSSSVDRSV